jgi:hypothetical protein
MKTTIAIGMLGLLLASNRAAAQTAVDQGQILREFDASVTAYVQHLERLSDFPEATTAATQAPKIFTLPVAMVFRQMIAHALALDPSTEALSHSLPALPPMLDYQLRDRDLIILDRDTNVTVAILRDATAVITAAQR